MVRAVLFDLDDTLFDHRGCSRLALGAVHAAHPKLRQMAFAEVERLHGTLLEELHQRVQVGDLSVDAAREERFRRLFAAAGLEEDEEAIAQVAQSYRDGYRQRRTPVAGARSLLRLVRSRARVGIVSNNLLAEQEAKLRHCNFSALVDVLVVSEETGVSKPDPRIFAAALERLGCRAENAVMVGDSWLADVRGALAAGIRPIWFNPLRLPTPDIEGAAAELRALHPPEQAMAAIFGQPIAGAHRRVAMSGRW